MSTLYVLIRKWHRDIGYFFVGLTLSFSISGIALNHRYSFDAEKYVYFSKEFKTQLNTTKRGNINDDLLQNLLVEQGINVKYMGFRIENSKKLNIFLEGGMVVVDMNNGIAKCEINATRPVIGQTILLHISSHYFWIWYSDIFAFGLIAISITGMFMLKGKNSFRKRGYKFALAGIIIPVLMLLFTDL